MKRILALTAATFVLASAATAQQTFEQTIAAAQAEVGDIARYQEALQNPDPRFQYALIQQMLKLPDPALQRIAKEHALFSTNPVMREAAIKAIFDAKTTLRMQFAGSGETYDSFTRLVSQAGGVFVGKTGELLTPVPEAINNECWGTRGSCRYRQVGNSVQIVFDLGNRISFNANVTLGNDGVLRGTARHYIGELVQMQIDLKQ